jgi:hypothetical protein
MGAVTIPIAKAHEKTIPIAEDKSERECADFVMVISSGHFDTSWLL